MIVLPYSKIKDLMEKRVTIKVLLMYMQKFILAFYFNEYEYEPGGVE